jgi:hypothetical protein
MAKRADFVPPRGINVLGSALQSCSAAPLTGFFRDGCCRTDESDVGVHTVCVVATADFLEFSRQMGNDLSTPRPEFSFPGVQPGERWCVCAARWVEALRADRAPTVVLAATHVKTLEFVDLDTLLAYAVESEEH